MNGNWLNVDGKVAIVTGGASGIGQEIANEFLNNGVNVVIADIKGEEGKREDGSYFISCNVTSKQSVDNAVQKTVELFGSVDILVNNAGVNLPRLLVMIRVKNQSMN
ncbi:sorbitol-6-phosphate 2-dehydrogenase [Gracilibacillus boraciitolerans JCM 21714]|uniref:Sorbitol-6-phosphate 2-dehydrogenase n=1 Tax=Gracilibacillus boraciitolerans JCM 21714 TaxID=1298598 RepID=W4VJR6_9BACI|nr:sorbitol-6-phosphate 2-dehydrogenase [Gracilibacillus boraciitolerans JCM 21714]